MYSDDEDGAFCAGRSPSPGDRRARDGDRGGARSTPKVGRDGGGKGQGQRQPRTTGRELPRLNSIHKGTIARVQAYGAFVRLGDGQTYKDGLLHISRLSATGRVEQVEDVVAEGDTVWVKVVEVRTDEGKYSLDMRYVGQKDGEDKDPNNTQADSGGKGKGGKAPEPIRIGAVQDTTCSRCGARGHMARECWAGSGAKYELLEEARDVEAAEPTMRADVAALGHDPKVIKAALKAYLKRKAPGSDSSSSSSSSNSSSSSKSRKKKKKKTKKKEKHKHKKDKKELKKAKKALKKAKAKRAMQAKDAGKRPRQDPEGEGSVRS